MKDSFIIFTESRELVEVLNDSQKAALLDALFSYAEDKEIDFPDPMTKVVFLSMRQKIDAANQRYEDKCARNRENGSKGGRKPNGSEKTERLSDETEKTERFYEKPNGFEKTLPDTDPDTDPEPDERKTPTESKEKRKRFVPPTVEEVREYADEKGLRVDAERFVAFYASKGWMVGKNKMVSWHQALSGWAARDKSETPPNRPARDDPPATGGKYAAFLSSIDYSKLAGGTG